MAGCADVVVHHVDGSWGDDSVDEVSNQVDEILIWMPVIDHLGASERKRYLAEVHREIEWHLTPPSLVEIKVSANIAIGCVAEVDE